jgi:metallo-beta-lactamase family protein
MKIIFLGGVETVTGSRYLVESGNTRILVDCGLFQGYKWLRERNRETMPVDLDKLDAIILTHAHLDHSGYLPVLYQKGYRGPVYCHHATRDLCRVLLIDSGHIQEEDARFYSRHRIGRHENPLPLYDRATAEQSLSLFESLDFNYSSRVGEIGFRFQRAGHILGAASVILEVEGKQIGFSGDVGRPDDFFMPPPEPLPPLDLLMLESTYGNRFHESVDPFGQLAEVVQGTAQSGGVLLIPSFSVGRAQKLQHMLTHLMQNQVVPTLPVFLDSPMAIDVSDIYFRYLGEHRLTEEQCRAMGQAITYTRSVEDSKALADLNFPHIIIAGSGMATGGRILHHMKRLIGDHRTTLLFTGHQAGGTRGAKMLAGQDTVKIHGSWFPVRANISLLDGLSGHADGAELCRWLDESSLPGSTQIRLVHGDPEALDAFRDYLRQRSSRNVEVATYKQILKF